MSGSWNFICAFRYIWHVYGWEMYVVELELDSLDALQKMNNHI